MLLALAAGLGWSEAPARESGGVEPVGIWSCLVYGDPVRGEERIVMLFTPAGESHAARQTGSTITAWRRLEDWRARGRRFSVVDPVTRRGYHAELDRPTLGGTWAEGGRSGGWWCARRPEPVAAAIEELARSSPEFFIPPLVPEVMTSPRYPREAIQEAKEGRAIVCFLVDASGVIRDPEILELSDPVFDAPTLRAIERSRYRPSARAAVPRPGCRHYRYELRAAY